MNRKEQKEIFLQLAENIRQVGKHYKHALIKPDVSKSEIDEIVKIESQADSLRDELDKEYKRQDNIPYLALDRAKLLRRIDDSIDDFVKAAYTIQQFYRRIPKSFTTDIKQFAEIIEDVAKELADGIVIIFESFKEAAIHVERIEEIRDRGMDLGYQLISKYFEILDEEEGWKPFISVERILLTSMECLTTMKETSEALEVMIYKYD